MPSLAVAVMVALPMPTPTAKPLLETVTMVESLLIQLKNWPPIGLPLASLAMADNCADSPRATLDDGGFSVTEATAAGVTVPGPKLFEDGPVMGFASPEQATRAPRSVSPTRRRAILLARRKTCAMRS